MDTYIYPPPPPHTPIKKRKKATTFKLIKLLKHTQKHSVTTEDRILIRHYKLDKSIEPENIPPNNTDLNLLTFDHKYGKLCPAKYL